MSIKQFEERYIRALKHKSRLLSLYLKYKELNRETRYLITIENTLTNKRYYIKNLECRINKAEK